MKLVAQLPLVIALAIALVEHANAQQSPTPLSAQQRSALFDAADSNKNARLEKAEWLLTIPTAVKVNADLIWGRLDPSARGFVTRETFVTANGRLPS